MNLKKLLGILTLLPIAVILLIHYGECEKLKGMVFEKTRYFCNSYYKIFFFSLENGERNGFNTNRSTNDSRHFLSKMLICVLKEVRRLNIFFKNRKLFVCLGENIFQDHICL